MEIEKLTKLLKEKDEAQLKYRQQMAICDNLPRGAIERRVIADLELERLLTASYLADKAYSDAIEKAA